MRSPSGPALPAAWVREYMPGTFGTNARPLSTLRPLAWRWRLPVAAIGLLVGELAMGVGGRWPWRLVLAVACAGPAVVLRHRALGTAAAIASLSAVVGLLRVFCSGLPAEPPTGSAPQRVVADILEARLREGFGGRRGVALTLRIVEVVEGRGSLREGDRALLRVWRVDAPWESGLRVLVRLDPRRPRGTCNGGGDSLAEWGRRSGVDWIADAADDRSIEVAGRIGGIRIGLARARERIARTIDEAVDGATAPILRAIVVGETRGLDPALREAYSRTGTTHVLSVSGLHVAIVAAAAGWLCRLLFGSSLWLAIRVVPARLVAPLALIPAVAYALLAGAAVPTIRSMATCAAFLLSVSFARRANAGTAMAAGALWIGLLDPEACREPSFQLSFGAVLAIGHGIRALERTRLRRWLVASPRASRGHRAISLVVSALAVSATAALGTAPITAAHFGTISAAGVIANLVVIPLVGWIALLAGLTGASLVPVSEGAAHAAFAAGARVIAIANRVVLAVASLPGSAFAVRPPSPGEAACWVLLLAACVVARRAPRVGLLVVGLSGVVLSRVWSGGPAIDGNLRISFLDVGQGDSTLLEQAGEVWLVDGGGGSGDSNSGERILVPALRRRGIGGLAAVALTHPQLDHYGGLASVVERIRPREFWSTGAVSPSAAFTVLQFALDEGAVVRRSLHSGVFLPPPSWGASSVEVLGPSPQRSGAPTNDGSLVLRWVHGATSLLLAGDVEASGERDLLARGGLPSVLARAPHHGSRTSSQAAFVEELRAALVVAGVGARNRFDLPSKEIPPRYGDVGALWLDTASVGEVVAESDGQLVAIETCRSETNEADGQSPGFESSPGPSGDDAPSSRAR